MEASVRQSRTLPLQLALLLAIGTGGLLIVARSNYLLFHVLVEGFTIVVALSVFVIAWTARRYLESAFLLVIGIAFFYVGLIELVHALAYPGMAIFAEQGYQSSQLWLGARSLQAASFIAAFGFVPIRRRPNRWVVSAVCAAFTALLLASIFRWKNFPACFVEGVGQTPFKVWGGYAIVALFALALALLRVNRQRFEGRIVRAVTASLVLAIAAEVCFTLYASPRGVSNMVGHFLHFYSYVAIYVALVESCLERPFELVFRELITVNTRLLAEIAVRKEVEEAREQALRAQRAAVEEVRELRGIIPICSHCKKIRDDEGAWSQLEAYLQRRSAAQFSHGICPDCLERHYPDLTP